MRLNWTSSGVTLSVVLRLAVADGNGDEDEEEDEGGVDKTPAPAFSLIASAASLARSRPTFGCSGAPTTRRRPGRKRSKLTGTRSAKVQRGREEESNEAKETEGEM